VTSLLFDRGGSRQMKRPRAAGERQPMTGSFPSGPEAIVPNGRGRPSNVGGGHRFVLGQGGTHFNLRATLAQGGAPLGGLLRLENAGLRGRALAAARPQRSVGCCRPMAGGNNTYPLMNVTPQLKTYRCLPIPKDTLKALKTTPQARTVRET